ncbi:hypothetical protein ABZV68_32295 [Streptomyces clavifer]|uniref:hypothetical protein n=1 Tax=Streptomyces clavifer TaxID=68188 RepID=UPI0033B24948
MTHDQAAAALEETRLGQHIDRNREDLADDTRAPAELAEWERIVRLLATTGEPYEPESDTVVQAAHAAEIEASHRRTLAARRQHQEQQAEAARRAALRPDILLDALLRTLTRAELLPALSEEERAVVARLPHVDPDAASAVNGLIARAYDAGRNTAAEEGRS